MNKFLFTLILLLSFSLSHSQIGEGKLAEKPILVGKATKSKALPDLVYFENETDKNVYILSFNNLEYPSISDIKQITFIANQNELDTLYNFLLEGFKDKELRTIDVGSQTLYIKKTAMSIKITVKYNEKAEPDGWFYLSKKQLMRLFGKK